MKFNTSPKTIRKNKNEAIANIKKAIQAYIAELEEDHLPVPEKRFETLIVTV